MVAAGLAEKVAGRTLRVARDEKTMEARIVVDADGLSGAALAVVSAAAARLAARARRALGAGWVVHDWRPPEGGNSGGQLVGP